MRCTSTGRRCCYDGASQSARTESSNISTSNLGHLYTHSEISSSPRGEQQAGWRERRAFEFYYHRASPLLSGDLDLAFWRDCVLQTCRMEPAVWDAIISLSALYERPPLHETPPFRLINTPAAVHSQTHRDALVWYSRSLAVLQQRINQGTANLGVSLISCILFIAIELLQGNRKAALALYKQGAQLINADRGPWITILTPIFRRLGIWVFINDESPDKDWGLTMTIPSSRFTSMDEARDVICDIVAEMKNLNNATKLHWKLAAASRRTQAIALKARRDQLREELGQWHRLFMSFKASDTPGTQDALGVDGASALLLMTYKSLFIEIETVLCTDQTAYDEYEFEFGQILEYASTAIAATRSPDGTQPPFMFEMGVFLPLFITALKCRSPQLRRQALQLMMEEAPPAQGLFMCGPAAHVIAVIVILEENPSVVREEPLDICQFLKEPGCNPPFWNRVWDFGVSSNQNGDGQVQNWLHYKLRDFDDDDEGRIRFLQRSILFPRLNTPLYDS
ncbi:hypothetical protein PMG11_03823 [Penicillium brasilianum]|uniref:C6 zinc finger domain protein n=1 Tax=Penicillium brasilianum TaxID=104259 RepID=A0A0F7VI92_PENBI|nr:hypothetical protein PMG11_03823 [Penicillium brasilianum]